MLPKCEAFGRFERGSIVRLPVCFLICMPKLISQSVAPSVVWLGVLDTWSSNKRARQLEFQQSSSTLGARSKELHNWSSNKGARQLRSSNRAARRLELEQRSSPIGAPT